MSYRKHHIKNRINRLRPKKSIFKMLWFWILILVVFFISSCAYFGLFYSGIQVNNIVVVGNEKINANSFKNLVSQKMDQKVFGILPTKSILLVNDTSLRREILKNFPLISSIIIQKQFPQTLICKIEERTPVAFFCQNSDNCFYIDKNGILFEGDDRQDNVNITISQELQSKIYVVGDNAISSEIIQTILKIEKNLKDNFKINLAEANIISSNRLNIRTEQNWEIYFSTENNADINMQLTKLNLLLKEDITSKILETLQYIDLRFKDRAYYK